MDDYYDNNDFDVDKFNKTFKENQEEKDEKSINYNIDCLIKCKTNRSIF